ncbi:hypothetical protein FEM48_Zijuj08G0117700 [Ziziphus jujuba var. spinosa]|uniref:Protein kinase domain-containing protein n=1 Tax=Ziziphus jujuba var. spinosa TaxID=714518 RepID=A0A978UYX1_ZIZJJ|nr:hypothetical protein FEM48_Zijuj08G0117700 [Ziziphus jujuba var. spinosa]
MEWVRGEEIGSGSFATISLAVPRKASAEIPPLMAVKSSEIFNSASINNEKEILDQLADCPQVIRCFGENYSTEKGEEFHNLMLEYASGGSLVDQLKKNGGRLSESDIRRYTRTILKGEKKTEVELRGTPLYMSPESVNDNEYESPSDIWALGCAVVEMMTGKPAWNCEPGSNICALLIRIGVGEELPQVPEELSEEGKDFLGRCFVKDPRKRWTADMLLKHPFISDDDTVSLEELSTSPRSPFDFPEWVSMQSTVRFSKLSEFSPESENCFRQLGHSKVIGISIPVTQRLVREVGVDANWKENSHHIRRL